MLDLYCCAGGAAAGYHRAGFDIVGVDHRPQPNYPFPVIVADALEYLRAGLAEAFDAIHASPPCQFATKYRNHGRVKPSPNLIGQTRDLLRQTGLPYVIENVESARDHLEDPVLICGSMFDLDVQRHRLFETNWQLEPPVWPCRHRIWGVDRYPGGRSVARTGTSRGLVRGSVEIGTWDIPLDVQYAAMGGCEWMTLEELSEAIPPDYTAHIGEQLLETIAEKEAA